MNLILGAGLSGLSASYHLGHQNCRILEKRRHAFGHVASEYRNGFTWDEGPHVSFTKSEYVRALFAESVQGEFLEYPVRTANYYQSHWIDHPAQSNLYQVPEPLRSACIESFLLEEQRTYAGEPKNYQEWLNRSLGKVFAQTFSAAYTRKYWTRSPEDLTWKWVGPRVFRPKKEDILGGSRAPLPAQTHYITSVRYPVRGGFESFAKKLAQGAQIRLRSEVTRINLSEKFAIIADRQRVNFAKLINTLPLPVFVGMCENVPVAVREAAESLCCSSILLVEVEVAHPTVRPENWIYVYDESKWSTRINCTELLSPNNAPMGATGIQVEVYFSKYKPQQVSDDEIARQVVAELVEMGLIQPSLLSETRLLAADNLPTSLWGPPGTIRWTTRKVGWANVIFDHSREPALDLIFGWLEQFGLGREEDDLDPFTDWTKDRMASPSNALFMAGRFGQWKYFWSDDCVLRGRRLSLTL